MNCTQDTHAMATAKWIARQSPKGADIATKELDSHLEQQVDVSAPESFQKIRLAMRDMAIRALEEIRRKNRAVIENALSVGQRFLETKQGLKRLEYKIFLGEIGWSIVKANKYAKLAKTFADFSLDQIEQLELTTLFSLCLPKYSDLVEKLHSIPQLTQQKLEQLMKEFCQQSKPRLTKPVSGWKPVPGGGRCYQFVAHDDELGVSIERHAQKKAVLPVQVVKEAMLLLDRQEIIDQQNHPALIQADSCRLQECENWEEIESYIKCGGSAAGDCPSVATRRHRTRFAKAVKSWAEPEKQQLVSKLAAHLNKNPQHLRSLTWIPAQLLLKALFASSLEKKLFPTTAAYNPYPRGAAGARKNWEAMQARNAPSVP
jgi:hypothetical protein